MEQTVEQIFHSILKEAPQLLQQENAQVADYIPQLSFANPQDLGLTITLPNGESFFFGESTKRFTIQSIGKILTLAMVLEEKGYEVFSSRVGVEASGDPFNSIKRLEDAAGKPSNPMINAGAIATCSFLAGTPKERLENYLTFAGKMLGNPQLQIDNDVYLSESKTGHRNRGLAFYMASHGLFGEITEEEIRELCEFYFQVCSLNVNCQELSYLGAVLAGDGKDPRTGTSLISKENAQIIRGIMVTAGMYDGSGEAATQIGFPAKSGVAGGIVGVIPKKMGIGTYAPALDAKGNSLLGMTLLKALSSALDLFSY